MLKCSDTNHDEMRAGRAMVSLGQPPPIEALTQREYDILRLLNEGLSDREIAEQLVITVGTVKWYNRQIYNKLNVPNRTQAIVQAQRQNEDRTIWLFQRNIQHKT